MCMVGSELYAINNYGYPSFDLWVKKSENGNWLADVPKMTVARDNAIAGILDGKIYVMGGFSIYESKNWAEVYDTKTQTWESLPDPGVQLRNSTLTKMEERGKKIYITSNNRNAYDVMVPKKVDGKL